jgi:hypothetical protein
MDPGEPKTDPGEPEMDPRAARDGYQGQARGGYQGQARDGSKAARGGYQLCKPIGAAATEGNP